MKAVNDNVIAAALKVALLLIGVLLMVSCSQEGDLSESTKPTVEEGATSTLEAAEASAPQTGVMQELSDSRLVPATEIYFMESEAGIEPYQVRMLLTNEFLRIDDGENSEGYLLYDRASKSIFSVSSEEQSIFIIEPGSEALLQESTLDFKTTLIPDAQLPQIGGKNASHRAFIADERVCYSVISVEGVLPDLIDAFEGYLSTLASEQTRNLNKTPVEMRTDCMLTNLIYKPVQHLQFGFPVREWDDKGYIRELVSYQAIEVDAGLFILDPEYSRFSSQDVTPLQ